MATAKVNSSKTEVKGSIPVNTGLPEKARQQVIDILNHRLADTEVLYTKTRKYHWNVTGIEFIQLHLLFEGQYEELADSIDDLAERVRKLGGFALGTLDEFKQYSSIEEQPGRIPDAQDMIRNLLDDHETIIRHLRKDADTTDEIGDAFTNDFLIGLAEKHEKTAWFLRAHLENATR